MLDLQRYGVAFGRARVAIPLLLEFSISLASVRMAALLLTDQGYFERYRNFYGFLLQYFPSQEWKWGLLAAVAASCKLVGMVLALLARESLADVAFAVRAAGWGLSSIFWCSFCLSISWFDGWSLGSICAGTLMLQSVGVMMTGPVAPEVDADGGWS